MHAAVRTACRYDRSMVALKHRCECKDKDGNVFLSDTPKCRLEMALDYVRSLSNRIQVETFVPPSSW